MEVQGLLGNVHKLQTSRHRPRILIIMFELQKVAWNTHWVNQLWTLRQFGFLARPIYWFLCMTNRLFMSNNTGDVQFITNLSRWSLDKTRQELKCLLVLCAFPVIWLHDGDVLDGIKPRVLVLRQESTQSNRAQRFSWGWSAGGWVQVSGELGRRNNSTAA